MSNNGLYMGLENGLYHSRYGGTRGGILDGLLIKRKQVLPIPPPCCACVFDGVNDKIDVAGVVGAGGTWSYETLFSFNSFATVNPLYGTSAAASSLQITNSRSIKFQPGTSSYAIVHNLQFSLQINIIYHLAYNHYAVGFPSGDPLYEVADLWIDGSFCGRAYAASSGVHGVPSAINAIGYHNAVSCSGKIWYARQYGNYILRRQEILTLFNDRRWNSPLRVLPNTANLFIENGADMSENKRVVTLSNGAYLEGSPL